MVSHGTFYLSYIKALKILAVCFMKLSWGCPFLGLALQAGGLAGWLAG